VSLAAILRGIEVAQLNGTFSTVTRALLKRGPEHCAALARLKSFQRAPLGDELNAAYDANTVPEQVAVLRAAAFLPEAAGKAWIDRALRHKSPAVRAAAVESGIRQRQRPAWAAAREAVAAAEAGSVRFLRLIAIFGQAADHRAVYEAVSNSSSATHALWALGHIGTREAVEQCLEAMQDPALARVAGEAYTAITGADLFRERLVAPESDETPSLPPIEVDDLDADLVPHREDLWPLPDRAACAAHWARVGGSFAPGTRYLRGAPLDLNGLMAAVESAPMLRRSDYALELYVRSAGACDVETRAAGPTQRRMIAAARARLGALGG